MTFLRPLCSISALLYCFFLGIFSLAHKDRSRLHVNFALYNFANALYNLADSIFLFRSYDVAVHWNRITGIGGCMMVPFVMRFVFELIEEQSTPYRWIGNVSFYLGIFLSFFYVTTDWFIKGIAPDYREKMLNLEIPGILYPLFILFVVSGLVIIVYRVAVRYRRTKSSLLQQKMRYIVLALCVGILALSTYFLSFVWLDLPIIYYTLQALVAFIFSYAIFKHSLLPINLAVRRFLLVAGIYLMIGVSTFPVFLLSYKHVFATHSGLLLFCLILCSGLFFSAGPLLYAQMVRRSTIFQNSAALHLTHEFKTPLGAIQSAKEILDRELALPLPDFLKVQEYMDMIQRNTQRLEKFVTDILNVSKALEPSRELQKQNVNVEELIGDTISHFPNAGKIKFTSEPVPFISADAEALRQVFTNLIANARVADPHGNVEVHLMMKDQEMEFIVRDHGRGIPADDLERIFQPFARAKQGGHAKSTGLGLAIAARWVRAHNGRIWAQSEGVGKGAAFFVVLPIA
jgi:signal transduction histidine kinase